MNTFSHHRRGLMLAAAGTTLFSCKGILIKLCYLYGATPEIVIALRMIFSLPFYLFMAVIHYPKAAPALNRSLWGSMFVLGLMGYFVSSLLDMYGLMYISASLERIILYAYPSMVLLLSVVFLHKPFRASMALCIAVIYSGLALVFLNPSATVANPHTNENMVLGSLLVFTAAFTYSIFLVGTEKIIRTVPNLFYTAIAMLSASAAIFIYTMFAIDPIELLQQGARIYGLSLLIAIFCTVLPSFMVANAIHYIGATQAGAVGSAGPLVTLILASVMLDESITAVQFCGFVIVMSGIYWLSKNKN